jgi:hypothetical protein
MMNVIYGINNLGCSFRAKLLENHIKPRVAVAKNAILALGCHWADLSGQKAEKQSSCL